MPTPSTDLGPVTPLPLPPSATHAVLFGGSFDPPHLAHAKIPPVVRDRRFGPGAWLLYIPAARSPHKDQIPAAPDADRMTLLRLATRAVDRSMVWADEINRSTQSGGGGPSYTVDTVRRARSVLPDSIKLSILIGSDQAAAFHTWREPREILALAEPVVMLRPPHLFPDSALDPIRAASFWTGPELKRWEGAIDAQSVMDASSTVLRGQLAAHDAGAATLLDPRVLKYIEDHDLYRLPRTV